MTTDKYSIVKRLISTELTWNNATNVQPNGADRMYMCTNYFGNTTS